MSSSELIWAPPPWIAPRAAQERPGAIQEAPRGAQERPGAAQDRPGASQERPRAAQEQPRAAQERPRAAQERSKGHLGAILARFGTFLGGKICVFPYVFQHFLKHDVFNNVCILKQSWCSTWGILDGQERPKSEPRSARASEDRPKNGQEQAKSGPRAAQSSSRPP